MYKLQNRRELKKIHTMCDIDNKVKQHQAEAKFKFETE